MTNNKNLSYFASFSGGKDSCLALFLAMQKWGKPRYLVNMLTEDGVRSRAHGLSIDVLKAQANLLNIPILFCSTTWSDYESKLLDVLRQLKDEGIEACVAGDMLLENYSDDITHRDWIENLCAKVDMIAHEPLWDMTRKEVIQTFIEHGFVAKIIAIRDGLNVDYLGRDLDFTLFEHFLELGIDPLGEDGEYHTVVTDGPIFSKPLELKEKKTVLKSGYWFLDVQMSCRNSDV